MIIAVDIDGTICDEIDFTKVDKSNFDWVSYYKTRKSIPDAVERIKEWYESGHHIIILTSRKESDSEVTIEWLKRNGIKYHEIIFDKVRADLYIDNNSLRILPGEWDNVVIGRCNNGR